MPNRCGRMPEESPMPDRVVCRRLVVHGRVQGVGYRWSMVREAERIDGLSGWVRNRRDGTVEAVAAGRIEAIEMLIAWARVGPAAASVSRVHVLEHDADEPSGLGFEQRPTV